MAMVPHRKVRKLKVSFDDDPGIITIPLLYHGETFVDNLKPTIGQNKEQSQVDWLKSDGSATKFCADRPTHKFVRIDSSQRTTVESEEWRKAV